jgi:membrane fusion protein (multidrug efflux system)
VNPQVLAGQVQKRKALLDLSRTEVRAPESGVISQSDRLQVGQMMVSGLPAVTIVSTAGTWIEANFKETDLNNMRVGQTAELTFDAYPKLKIKGRVASIGAGTGSEFSVLPAQNANGNWVKVTQRVPVRITIDTKPARPLIAGLSTHVRIDTSSR